LKSKKREARYKRHRRVRKKSFGTTEKPRFNVFKSLNHIYAQIIDDSSQSTLVCAASLDKELKGKIRAGGNTEAAKQVGTLVAKRALDKGIRKVTFDRGGYPYHGRVKTLAEAARESGLEF
jgi:large subunit ribosomal protein L18